MRTLVLIELPAKLRSQSQPVPGVQIVVRERTELRAQKKNKTKKKKDKKKQEDTENIFFLSLSFSCSRYFSFAHHYLNAWNRLRSSSIRLDMADIANFDRSSHRRQRSKML